MPPAASPMLSVVLPTWDTFDAIRRTIDHLNAQTVANEVELLICAPDDATIDVDRNAVSKLHSVRVLPSGTFHATGSMRANAIRAASASIVAFAEDHCFPDREWAHALLRAHKEPHAAVSPAFRNANPETVVSRADLLLGYGRWHAPGGRRRTMPLLPGHNTSYKRDVLVEYGAKLDDLMETETLLLWDLRRRGHTLLFEPAASVEHTNFSAMSVWLDAQWHLGKVFASTRAAHWSWLRRVLFSLATPLIPALRTAHVFGYGIANRLPITLLVGTYPAVVMGLVVDCVAQATGTLFGAGQSLERLTAYEFHRADVNATGQVPRRSARTAKE